MDNKAQQTMKGSAGGSVPFYVERYTNYDGFLILGDGGVVEFQHNGDNMVSTYYQSRIPADLISEDGDIDFDRLWDELSEGEVYLEDWDDEHTAIDGEMVNDAIGWLYCTTDPEPTFTKVDSVNEIGLAIKSGRY